LPHCFIFNVSLSVSINLNQCLAKQLSFNEFL
jgi:hypothetical protein